MSIPARTISKAYGGLPSHTERGLQLTEWSYPGASVESPGCRLEVNCKYSQLIIGSEVSITTYNLLIGICPSAAGRPISNSGRPTVRFLVLHHPAHGTGLEMPSIGQGGIL